MEKKIIILGRIGNTVFQNNDSGKVLSWGGCYEVHQNDGSKYSDGSKTMEKKIIVLGGLGVSERRDRDPDRILHGGGIVYALPAHIQTDKPLVVRKWEKN